MNTFQKAPVKNKVPIRIQLAFAKDGGYWDKHIRPVVLAVNQKKTAFHWSWIARYVPYAPKFVFGLSAGRCYTLKAVTKGTSSTSILSGLMTIVEGVEYPPDVNKKCVYLWFLEGTPDAYFSSAGVTLMPKAGEALIDAAIVASIKAGFEGRLLLHAAPSGGQHLFDYYKYLGLQQLPMNQSVAMFGKSNDGRYFYADEQTAAYIVGRNNRYR